ncbi:MAG TPA: hypothetical protein VFS21_38835 [Roseiflexaceae bacterium]|nr:hypothetical protein [Roseiflexaceae bacterium]
MHKHHLSAQLLSATRRILGLCCLVIGILGCILPILPGWPFLIPAILLLGRRDPWLRHSHLVLRRSLRLLRRADHPLMRWIGDRLSVEYLRGKRALMPRIVAMERTLRM